MYCLFSEICVKLFNGILIELFDRYNTVLYRIYFSGHPVYIICCINEWRIAILCSKNRVGAYIYYSTIRDRCLDTHVANTKKLVTHHKVFVFTS